MFVCRDIKVVFVAVPKTGTRSIYNRLGKNYGGVIHNEHARVIPPEFKPFFAFTIVRNPYDRACSAYWHVCKRKGTERHGFRDRYGYDKRFKQQKIENNLENFLIEVRRVNQSINQGREPQYYYAHCFPQWRFHEKNTFNQILRFENLQEDFMTLPFIDKEIQLPMANTTTQFIQNKCINPRPPWEDMVNDTTIKLINEIYAKDFKIGKYKKI